MSNREGYPSPGTPAASAPAVDLQKARVLLVGLGNIGSFLAILLAPMAAFIRLVDRDTVQLDNTTNQFYGPEHERETKVDVAAERIKRLAPHVQVERRAADLEDLPWGDFADVDIGLAGLDSLRARQILAEKLYRLQKPLIDGAVGDPALVRVQVLLSAKACLECSWSAAHYRQLTTEYPCQPGASAEAPRTLAPGCAGAATASVMVAHFIKLLSADPPQESYEINGDLLAGRFVKSLRRRNERCRFRHDEAHEVIRFEKPLAEATVADLVATVGHEFGQHPAQLEFRRGILDSDLFGAGRFALPAQLHAVQHRRLDEIGLTPRDHVVVRTNGRSRTVHICFNSTGGSLS